MLLNETYRMHDALVQLHVIRRCDTFLRTKPNSAGTEDAG